jgi:hydroxyacylglutathione hydrolase
VTLLANSEEDVTAAQRSMARIGINHPAGGFIGDLRTQQTGAKTGSYPVGEFEDLVETMVSGKDIAVLDVRRHGEWSFGHIRGAYHIPFHELERRISELPDAEIWIYCATGYRASVAASMLDRAGRSAVLVDGNWEREGNLLPEWVVRNHQPVVL